MLNNEFRFIGTVITDYRPIGTDSYIKYELKIEVEKKSKGKTAVYPVVVLGTNKTVDFAKSLKGKKVIAQGYIDIYKEHLSLVLQDFEVIGEMSEPCEPQASLQDYLSEPVLENPEPDEDEEEAPDLDLPDDDLPF